MKIRYKTRHGVAEWVEYNDCDPDTLTFSFEPYHDGVLLLGSKMLTLNNGEVTVSKKDVADGNYTPRLESNHGVYTVEGFVKCGSSISLYQADEALIRRLLMRCHQLEGKLGTLEERVSGLEKTCHGHQIFDFERKEK